VTRKSVREPEATNARKAPSSTSSKCEGVCVCVCVCVSQTGKSVGRKQRTKSTVVHVPLCERLIRAPFLVCYCQYNYTSCAPEIAQHKTPTRVCRCVLCVREKERA